MSELKPCPFCGGKARIGTEYCIDGFGNYHKVVCSNCGASSKLHFCTQGNEDPQYFSEVREDWQKRANSMTEREISDVLTQKLEQSETDKAILLSTLQNLLSNHSEKSIADARNVLNQFADQQ